MGSILQEKKRVCIIGGGPSGLVTLRRIQESPTLNGVLFEQKDDVGGLWNYKGEKSFPSSIDNVTTRDATAKYPNPEHVTAMYDGLCTNGPYVMAQLKDFEYQKERHCSGGTFPTQQELYQYLKDYASHFNLLPNIKLNTTVIDVQPENLTAPDGEPGRWIVKTHQHQTNVYKTEIFDGVAICIGNFTYPYYPKIPGLDEFKGKLMHSKFFKNAEGFEGQDVVCIGLGPSSSDLACMISKSANKVTVCHKFPLGYKIGLVPPNVRETQNVKSITSNGVITEEDEFIPCDTLILCTGYARKYSFFKSYEGIKIRNEKYPCDLYNMTIFSKRPTLSVMNIPAKAIEFVVMEIQARYFASILEGTIKLPSFEEMDRQIRAEEEQKIKDERPVESWAEIGFFGMGFWDYFAPIVEQLGIKDDCQHFTLIQQLYAAINPRLFGAYLIYKNDQFRIVNENKWEFQFSTDPAYPDFKPTKVTMVRNQDGTVTVDRTDQVKK